VASIGLADLHHSTRARAWRRGPLGLAKHEDLRGLGVASAERLEAWVFARDGEVLVLGREPGDLGAAALRVLLDGIPGPLGLARASRREVEPELLRELGFAPGAEHVVLTRKA
jgi:hypothetical protein